MFCHSCGARLVDGARFCSICGTPVPEELLNTDAAPRPTPAQPTTAQATPPQPAAPARSPSGLTGTLARSASPAASPAAQPNPAPAAPAPTAQPSPAPAAQPSPAPATPAAAAVPERIPYKLQVTVTRDLVEHGELIEVRPKVTREPVSFRVTPDMKTGTKLRLSDVPIDPAPDGTPRELFILLVVEEPEQQLAPASAPSAPTRTASGSTVQLSPTILFEDSCFHILFQLAENGRFKTGYHFGGNHTEGYLDLTTTTMALFGKSKGVALAFGAVGRAIEGKGKELLRCSRADVVSYEKLRDKKGRITGYNLFFRDGRALQMIFVKGPYQDGEQHVIIMDLFLTQKHGVKV